MCQTPAKVPMLLDSSLGRHAPPVVMPLLSSAEASTPPIDFPGFGINTLRLKHLPRLSCIADLGKSILPVMPGFGINSLTST